MRKVKCNVFEFAQFLEMCVSTFACARGPCNFGVQQRCFRQEPVSETSGGFEGATWKRFFATACVELARCSRNV